MNEPLKDLPVGFLMIKAMFKIAIKVSLTLLMAWRNLFAFIVTFGYVTFQEKVH